MEFVKMAPVSELFAASPSYKLFTVSTTGEDFTFFGEDYGQVRVFDDGYLCFGPMATPVSYKNTAPPADTCSGDNSSFPAYDSHFGGGMPCFSYLLTGLAGHAGAGGYNFKKCYSKKRHMKADGST